MIRISFALIIAALVLLPGSLDAADWPQFRGPNGDGISREKLANKDWNNKPPKMLWKTAMNDEGYAGISAAGGKVFIVDHKDKQNIVRAIDIKTGKDVWQYAYDDTDKTNYGFTRCTPVFNGGRLYTLSMTGKLNCLDAKTGKRIWSRDILQEFQSKQPVHCYSHSPLIDGNKLIVSPGGPDAGVAALDKNTGKTIWKGAGSDEAAYATPQKVTINGRPQYLVFTGNGPIGVDVNTGERLWSFVWESNAGINVAAPIVMGDTVFITSGYGYGCALIEVSKDGAKARWKNKEIQAHFSSPIYWKGYIYSNSDPNHLVCMDPETGEVKWKQPGFEKGPVIAVDGVLIAAEGAKGNLVMVEPTPEGYKELGRFKPLGDQIWTSPIIASGKLIVRDKSTLACFDLR
ncbi:MAG: PQQ-binding-like beta-propeller repeat protein [Armatimonadetes bacterium]|nr:PQQ-binding-like beta-propeller repeat protein [Armatimonadota bacterium]